jgi:YVTN family beta-propeller protein
MEQRYNVANGDSNDVSVIDTATNTVIATVNVGTSPTGVSVTPDGKKVYVANWGNQPGRVSVIDTSTNTVTASVPVGSDPVAFGQFIGPEPVAPTITWNNPADIVYGTPLSDAQLNATASDPVSGAAVPGTFVYNPALGTVLSAGMNTLNVSFTPTNTIYYNTTSANVSITVTQAIPTITWNNPADIIYGTALCDTQLNATASDQVSGAALPGVFAYNPQSGTVLSVGMNHILNTTFTPTDAVNYTQASANVSINVLNTILTTPTITWNNPADIIYGTALCDTQLNAAASDPVSGAVLPGVFAYIPPSGTILTAGTQMLNVSFTPTDAANYTTASANVSINVTQVTPTITWNNPADVVYGTPLSGAQLNATASDTISGAALPGVFAYTPPSGTILSAGTQMLNVSFTPTDATNYTTASANVSINVTQATPTVTWSNPANITYGTVLDDTQLNAIGSVPGITTYNPPLLTLLSAGTQTLTATLTPTDNVNYTTASANVPINVTQTAPTITWNNPANITYGTALNGTQLDASASNPVSGTAVAGTFAYSPISGTILAVGTHTLTASFKPTDTTNYTLASANVSINIINPPTITWKNPANITYGTKLIGTQLDAAATYNGKTVVGTFAYTADYTPVSPTSGTVLSAGTHTLSTTFTPTSNAYTPASASVFINVTQITPTITWSTPASISYGTALSGTQLDATAKYNGQVVPGKFGYNPVVGTVLSAGAHALNTTFTPADTTNYTTPASKSVSITVTKAIPTITWSTPTSISYETALNSTQLNATATYNGQAVPGTFGYTSSGTAVNIGTVLSAGTHALTASFTPADTANYTTPASKSVSITVTKATPTITWNNPASINNDATASNPVSGTAVAGTFAYSPPSGTVLTAGTQMLNVSFTPTDATNYNTPLLKSVSITVLDPPAGP